MHVVQNRKIYERLNNEVGPNCTKRVYQEKHDCFYLDFAEVKCNAGCKSVGLRLKLYCGLSSFIESVKAICGVQIIEH